MSNAAIEQLLHEVQQAYANRDAAALAALHHPNCKYRLPSGKIAQGEEALTEVFPLIFEMLPEGIEPKLIHQEIDLIREDLAVVDQRMQNIRVDGDEQEAISVEGFTLVVVREQENWLVGAIRGAFVPKPA